MELTDIEAFIKEQKSYAKRLNAAQAKSDKILAWVIALRQDLAALTGKPIIEQQYANDGIPPIAKKRADIVITPQRIIAVQEAVRDILDRTPGHIFTPSELVGATHLGRQTIAAVFRHLGFSEKRGKFTAPTQGEDHADVTH